MIRANRCARIALRIARATKLWENLNGGSQIWGLSPKFSEKIGQNSFGKIRAFSGPIGAFSGSVGAFSGLIGTDSSAPHSRGEAPGIPPKGPFWAQLVPFGLSPCLLSPPLDFPKSFCPSLLVCFSLRQLRDSRLAMLESCDLRFTILCR